MDGWSREREGDKTSRQNRRQRKREGRVELKSTKLSSDKLTYKNTHTHREQGEGQGRINGCALIDKLIKQTKTSARTHIKTQTECKADTHLNNPN